MDFDFSPKVKALQSKLNAFMDEHIYPNERVFTEQVQANRAAGNAFGSVKIIDQLWCYWNQ